MSDNGLEILAADAGGPRRALEEPDDRPRRSRNRRILLVVVGALVLLLALGAAVASWYGKSVLDSLNSINRDAGLTPSGTRPPAVTPTPGQAAAPVNIVLMGSDTRGDERGRSDVLQVLHLSGDRKDAYLMSIPRDSWVPIPGHGTAKINAAYSWGGAALAVETVEQLLNVPMDHTVIIDFEGFVQVIDALGGVTVYNKHASGTGDNYFQEGLLTLNGEKALAYVRERKTLPGGDFDRAARQRDVIQAVVKELASAGVLSDPTKFRQVMAAIGPSFTVDSGLTNDAILDLATGSRAAVGNIHSMQLPITGTGTSKDGQSIVLVDFDAVTELSAALRADDMASFLATHKG